MRIRIKCIFLIWVFCIHVNAQKSDSLRCADAIVATGYKAKFTPFPFIAYSPDTRLMIGAFLLKQFKPYNGKRDSQGTETRGQSNYFNMVSGRRM